MDQLGDHMKENYTAAVTMNWAMWIPAQLINFKFVPPQYQVLFANFVALFWNAYLSWASHQPQDAIEEAPAPTPTLAQIKEE